jgi:single-stranded-DNA-specific exonuclease
MRVVAIGGTRFARTALRFRLDLNDWNGRERMQLLVRHIEPA